MKKSDIINALETDGKGVAVLIGGERTLYLGYREKGETTVPPHDDGTDPEVVDVE